MGKVTAAEIMAAHKRLMRFDPAYAERHHRNRRRRECKSRCKVERCALSQIEAQDYTRMIRITDDEIERLGGSLYEDYASTPSSTSSVRLSNCRVNATVSFDDKHRDPVGRRVRKYQLGDEALTVFELSERFGLKRATIEYRLARGCSVEEAVRPITPDRTYTFADKTLTLKEWAELLNVKIGSLRTRLYAGWSVEATLSVGVGTVFGRASHAGGWIKTLEKSSETAFDPPLDTASK